jgi:hypothetical protein
MKKARGIGIVVLLAAGLGGLSPSAAEGQLDRLEAGIRASSGPAVAAPATPQRVYLGAYADDDAGRGVRLTSVRKGGPADQAGLQAQDLIVGAAGRKIHLLSELSAILNGLKPGDRLALEFDRGNQPMKAEVVLGMPPPSAAQPGQAGAAPPTGSGAGRIPSIPPPPGDTTPAPLPEGPAFGGAGPQPIAPNSPQAQIEELRRRVDQLERKVQELERALAESQKK